VHRAKWFKWEGNSFLQVWVDGQVKVVFCPKQCENLVRCAHEKLGHFGSNKHIICSIHTTGGEGCFCKFSSLFLGVWCVTKFKYLSMHLRLTYNLYQLWGLGTSGVWIFLAH